ncbi:DUF1761 domain-containing protein [Arcticibacterium luteifluviistationis]|uniref:DUF1761 domain-containing protein n=1 Tax=Arcticibacterium luteifluviistationis TaxID=1784714 RepID=A0A2Z4GDG4_9BACT|nr:DUF1761 domain-containing protein [Arcticibacterium luteifluviistationis]AWV98953.1 DUF1761 domain-containing protein [Arcticibacterium luteifluviistationis]
MFSNLSEINWLAVLVAFVPYFMLGGLWFTALFKKPYAISLGKENSLPEKPAPIFIMGPALCVLVITIATAILISALQISDSSSAIRLALLVGLGYLVANTMNIAINPNIPKPILYGVISGAYHLVGIIVTCLILVAMQ